MSRALARFILTLSLLLFCSPLLQDSSPLAADGAAGGTTVPVDASEAPELDEDVEPVHLGGPPHTFSAADLSPRRDDLNARLERDRLFRPPE